MEPSRYAELFLSESRSHVSTINHHLLELERSRSPGSVEELFRAAHTLKGMSAAMGCTGAAALAHSLEHLLDRLRGGEQALDEPVMEALFESADTLEVTIAAEISGEPQPAALAPLLARLDLLAGTPSPVEESPAPAGEADTLTGVWTPDGGLRVTAMIQTSAALPAVRAMLVLRAVRELGEVSGVEPPEDDLTAGRFSGRLAFRIRTDADAEEIRSAVLRAGEVSHVEVEAPPSSADVAPVSPAQPLHTVDSFVRVSQQLLDTLVDRVGELVIARDRLSDLVERRAEGELLDDASEQMSRLIGEMRDEIMRMRMVPIGDAFDRFPRFVRDAGRALGKEVRFDISGRDTPLDRSLHHELADVLIHLLRNALDHGIEPAAERVARGKPAAGAVRLSAEAERSHVVVRVEDDGRGIDLTHVAEVAVASGQLTREAAEEATREELLHILTRPGFSTRSEVTDVSGRGVGLDVVASRVRSVRGVLEIESWPGEGTRFTLRLPLSLAILRTLQVEAGGSIYALPISAIEEVVELGPRGAELARDEGSFIVFREEPVPLLVLTELLHPHDTPRRDANTPVVVVHGAERLYAIAVNALHGHHEAVLKSFQAVQGMTDVFAGATLRRDGRPALVLDAVKLGGFVTREALPAGAPAAAAQS
jgi:two-component system, chemotaxis family, sensor kinase CheA